jgi:hypothetical protein
MTGFEGTPIDVFGKSYCKVCINNQCSRSLAGSLFNKRVGGWESRLFLNVPRADEKDPKFDHIRSKRFIPLNSDPFVINSKPEPVKVVEPLIVINEEKLEESETEIGAEIEESKTMVVTEPEIETEIVQPQVQPTPTQQVQNTPFNQGVILPRPTEISMEPGSTYVFGEDPK